MSIYIKVNGVKYPASVNSDNSDHAWGGRRSRAIRLTMTAEEAMALLPDNTPWSIVRREADGTVQEWDDSAFSMSGAVTDNRDGTVTIKMGEPMEIENARAVVTVLAGSSMTPERAAALRPVIEQAAASLSDNDAAKAAELFPAWADHIGETVQPGDRRSDMDADGVLRVYKVREGQGHTTQESWAPHLTPALWAVIDAAHTGTQDDPIPAARGMEYEYGKYYLDSEDGKTYLCERTGEAAGGKIVLQFLPHELIGQYFTEAAE